MVDGQFIVNPTYDEMREGLVNIMVVGTADGIVMIESGAKEVKEETVVDAIEFGHTEIKKICAAINDLRGEGRKAEAQGRAAAIRRCLLQRTEEEGWRRAGRRARYQEASQGGKLRVGQRDQEKAAAAIPEDDKKRWKSSSNITRRCASASSASR